MKTKKIFNAAAIITFILIGINIIYSVLLGIPSFDGAMNLQVPINMMNNGVYGTLYDGGEAFDIAVQTGIPVLFPIYCLYELFGVSMTLALFVNGCYLIGVVVWIDLIAKEINMDKIGRIFAIGLLFTIPKIFILGFGVYGEIPTLFWLLLTVWAFIKYEKNPNTKWMILSGVSFSMGILTKTVLYIAIPSILVVFFVKIFFEKQLKMKDLIIWITACAVPYGLFILYKFTVLGAEVFTSMTGNLFKGIMKQAGVTSGYADTQGSIFHKFFTHMGILSDILFIPAIILFLILAVNLLYSGYKIIKEKKLSYFDILTLTAYSYFGWWLLITSTEKAWLRRILIGIILMIFSICKNLSECEKLTAILQKKKSVFYVAGSICLVGICAVQIQYFIQNDDKEEKAGLIASSEYMIELVEEDPDAIFCGNGWWQAPIHSFLSGIEFKDLQTDTYDEFYYVRDKNEELNALESIESLDACYDFEMIYEEEVSKTTIYKVNRTAYFGPFTKEEEEKAVSEIKKDGDMTLAKGLHPYEQDSKNCWVQKESMFLLKADDNDSILSLDWRIANIEQMDTTPMTFSVTVNNKQAYAQEITQDGTYHADIPIDEFIAETKLIEVEVSTGSKIVNKNDARVLSWLFEGIQVK